MTCAYRVSRASRGTVQVPTKRRLDVHCSSRCRATTQRRRGRRRRLTRNPATRLGSRARPRTAPAWMVLTSRSRTLPSYTGRQASRVQGAQQRLRLPRTHLETSVPPVGLARNGSRNWRTSSISTARRSTTWRQCADPHWPGSASTANKSSNWYSRKYLNRKWLVFRNHNFQTKSALCWKGTRLSWQLWTKLLMTASREIVLLPTWTSMCQMKSQRW